MTSTSRDIYLVIGGSGSLGRHIVDRLLARGDTVSIFDIVQRYHDVPFYSGDLSEEEQIGSALQKVKRIRLFSSCSNPERLGLLERCDLRHSYCLASTWFR